MSSSTAAVTSSTPFFAHQLSTARVTMPRTKAGMRSMRSRASGSQVSETAAAWPYSIAAGCRRATAAWSVPGSWVQSGSSAIRSPVMP